MGKNINYIKTSLLLNLKQTFEYKINIYFNIVVSASYLVIHLFFLLVLKNALPNVLNWEFEKILFFILISQFTFQISAIFYYFSNLSLELLTGNFNIYLIRPINIFIQQFFSSTLIRPLFTAITYIIALIIVLIYYEIEITITKIFLSGILIIISTIFFISFMRFFDSLGFFFKVQKKTLKNVISDITVTVHTYPATLFSESKIKFFLLILPQVYYSAYLTKYFFGDMILKEYFTIIGIELLIITILITLIYLIWQYGLKKYEAFG